MRDCEGNGLTEGFVANHVWFQPVGVFRLRDHVRKEAVVRYAW